MEINKLTNDIIKLNKKNTKCPTCKQKSKQSFAPFCSRKCSDMDLMKWLSDQNSIVLNKK